MNLHESNIQDQQVYATAKEIFYNTKNETVKYFMAKVILELEQRGCNLESCKA